MPSSLKRIVVSALLLMAMTALGQSLAADEEGESHLPDGSTYRGEYLEGMFHGHGVLTWRNGNRFEGEFKEGMLNGQGKLEIANGDVFEGHFEEGFLNGEGKFIRRGKLIYQGEFKSSRFDGQGEWFISSGDHYVGEFKGGEMHGQGTYTSRDGRKFIGQFEHNDITGKGTMEYGQGNRYVGDLEDWMPQGEGEFVLQTGDIYRGTFDKGQLVGAGEYISAKGDHYRGDFLNWSYHGKGELVTSNGDRYTGEFEHGTKSGQGELVYKVAGEGEKKKSGKWEYDEFVADRDQKRNKREKVVEQALYGQDERLERELATLEAGTPGKIELYFLGVGGYGSQDVFRKEVDIIKAQMDERFDTQGRSIRLINNGDTASELPLATTTSIRRAIKAIEARMNTDEDILFLYLTSHGSEDHRLSLSMEGMTLRDLSATEMAEILDATSIKWRVVMVSACYSGGFVEPLESDSSLIITAAAKDRQSFGCSNDNEMTDFARAYFQVALPQTDSFEEAFAKAERKIADEEHDRNEKKESMPQLSLGKEVRDYLEAWRSQKRH